MRMTENNILKKFCKNYSGTLRDCEEGVGTISADGGSEARRVR
jgi:hypothetical protein